MVRQIGALLLATVVAPYLGTMCLMIFGPWPVWLFGAREFSGALSLGTICLIIFGVPLLLVSACITFAFRTYGLTRWPYFIGSGAVMGSSLLIFGKTELYFDPAEYPQVGFIAACIGALCGWIYWRIAIRRTAGNGYAIDPA